MLSDKEKADTAYEAEMCVNVLTMHIAHLSLELGKCATTCDDKLDIMRGLMSARDYVRKEHLGE